MIESWFMNYVIVGSNPIPVIHNLNIAPFTNKELIELQVTFWIKFYKIQVCDMKKTYTYSQGLHFSSVTFHSTSNPLRSSYHSAVELLSYKFLLERNLFTLHIKAFVNRNIQFNYIKFMDLSNGRYQQSVQVTKSINKLIQ